MNYQLILTFAIFICHLSTSQISAQDDNSETVEKSHSTSIAGMVELLKLEGDLIENLRDYADLLQTKVDTIRTALEDLTAENEKSKNDTEAYLSNPLNGYALIRRMHGDWISWQLFMESTVGQENIDFVEDLRPHMPTSTDLKEAATAIHRIQTTYDMSADDISKGLLRGKQYDSKLNSIDCFTLGLELLKQKKYYDASFWLYTVVRGYEHSAVKEALGLSYIKVLQVYAENFVKMNQFQEALQVLDVVLKHVPHDAKLLKLKYKTELEALTESEPPMQYIKPTPTPYQIGCRGQFEIKSRLYCRYNNTNSPFLKLAPIKMEEVQLDPYMVIFHDIVSDKEIEQLKELSQPMLRRATVYSAEKKKNIVMETRTSKVAWLYDNFSELTQRINRRIADMTGFEMVGSEALQMMNYGLGGHYELHNDYFNVAPDAELVRMNGDRIATVLFYLNDVEQGGATVFPHLKVATFPKKGTAIMWYNLDNSLTPDKRTFHAACPVIVGSKWVCNKWIRSKPQIFKRPCYQS